MPKTDSQTEGTGSDGAMEIRESQFWRNCYSRILDCAQRDVMPLPSAPPRKRATALLYDIGVLLVMMYFVACLDAGEPLYTYSLFLIFLYKPCMEFIFGRTLGKMLVGLCVTDRRGRMLSVKSSFTRSIPLLIMAFPLVLDAMHWARHLVTQELWRFIAQLVSCTWLAVLIDLSAMFVRKDKRMLHDVFANSHCWEKEDLTIDAIKLMNKLEYQIGRESTSIKA